MVLYASRSRALNSDASRISVLADEATALLKALSHPVRLVICSRLKDGEMSVGDMERELGIRQPGLSRELGRLREEGLVEARRKSKVIFYRLSGAPRLKGMIEAVCAVMLEEDAQSRTPAGAPSTIRPQPPGGYGIFSRSLPES